MRVLNILTWLIRIFALPIAIGSFYAWFTMEQNLVFNHVDVDEVYFDIFFVGSAFSLAIWFASMTSIFRKTKKES